MRTSSPRSAWSSTPSSCGTPATSTPPSPNRAEDHDIKDDDIARLSPLKDRHINFMGRYLFNITASGPSQGLRHFRDPGAVEDDEAED